jgi:ABC-2 type transport system permease protein
MSGSIVRHLILKDLHLFRWISLGAIVGGVVAAGLMSLSPMPINAGGVLVICALIVLNVFLVLLGVVQERKDKATLFILSLPVSPAQYALAKVGANLIAFAVPWVVITAAVAGVVTVSQVPDGILPLWLAVLAYIFFYYCVLLGVALNTDSTGWHGTVVTIGNISVNFVIMLLFGLPSVRAYGEGPVAVWTADVVSLGAAAIVGGFVALGIATGVYVRRSEFL